MKNLIMFMIFFCSANLLAQGQHKEKIDRIKSLKVAFITDELALTPEEAAKFWPIYNVYEVKQGQIRRNRNHSVGSDTTHLEQLSEKEAADKLMLMQKNEEELHQLRRNFVDKLRKVIPATKILKLKIAEETFNKKLLKQYRSGTKKR